MKKEGLSLRETAKMSSDQKQVDSELDDLNTQWSKLKTLSSGFTAELENSLVSSGRLVEAVENLEDWLMKVEPELSDVKQIDGDVQTIQDLIGQHRNCFVTVEITNYELLIYET